jgi:hypothetical protein
VQVTVTCPTGAEVLEAFLYVNQHSRQGAFAFFQPLCGGSPHTFTVRAQAVDFRYHVGQAQVSGYVLPDQRGPQPHQPDRHAPAPLTRNSCAVLALPHALVLVARDPNDRQGRIETRSL